MKISTSALFILSCASVQAQDSCITNGDSFDINGCDYEAVVDGLDAFLSDTGCNHDANTELELIYSTQNKARKAISEFCVNAWSTTDTSTFQDIDARFDDKFMKHYVQGKTFLNTETGSFQDTAVGNNIAAFRGDQAETTVLGEISKLSKCDLQSMMCCFGRDRQPNDNNGNCADPIETRCIDADPADNSNLCWVDTDHIPTFSDPFAFPEASEGAIHCHGLAWGDDSNSFTAQLRFNNLFYVSLYDHMYTRGYVETTVDSDEIPMCGCIEDMPPVSRADCTQVDVTHTFSVTYNNDGFQASSQGDMNVQFNACQGTNPGNGNDQNNDLGSYIYRLNEEGKLSDHVMDKAFDVLVGYANPGDNQNEQACANAYEKKFSETYPDDVANLKCPHGDSSRLFRTEDNDPLSLEECQDLCYDTPGCEYFSLGISVKGDFKGVCIGCTTPAAFEAQQGFNSYKMTETQVFPTGSPTPDSPNFDPAGKNVKCPHNSKSRLFRTPDNSPLTLAQCYDRCYETEGCKYFTLGVEPSNDDWIGVCMGCTEDSVLQTQKGFNSYVMEVVQDFPTASPTGGSDLYERIGTNKKCSNNNRIFRSSNNDPYTRDECYERCANTIGCDLFTFGEGENLKQAWKGLCIGCSSAAQTLATHNGFNTYEILP